MDIFFKSVKESFILFICPDIVQIKSLPSHYFCVNSTAKYSQYQYFVWQPVKVDESKNIWCIEYCHLSVPCSYTGTDSMTDSTSK